MTRTGATKLVLPLILIILIQCRISDAGKLSNLTQSVLETLRSIESLLKNDSIVIEDKPLNVTRRFMPSKLLIDALDTNQNSNVRKFTSINANANTYFNSDKDNDEVQVSDVSAHKTEAERKSGRRVLPEYPKNERNEKDMNEQDYPLEEVGYDSMPQLVDITRPAIFLYTPNSNYGYQEKTYPYEYRETSRIRPLNFRRSLNKMDEEDDPEFSSQTRRGLGRQLTLYKFLEQAGIVTPLREMGKDDFDKNIENIEDHIASSD